MTHQNFFKTEAQWKKKMLQEIFDTLNPDEYITLKVGEIKDLMESVNRTATDRTKKRYQQELNEIKLTRIKSAIYLTKRVSPGNFIGGH